MKKNKYLTFEEYDAMVRSSSFQIFKAITERAIDRRNKTI